MKKSLIVILISLVSGSIHGQNFERFQDSESKLWGYIDANGEVVIEAKYSKAGPEFDSIAYVNSESYNGFINMNGGQIDIYSSFDIGASKEIIKNFYWWITETKPLSETSEKLIIKLDDVTKTFSFGPTSKKCYMVEMEYSNDETFKEKVQYFLDSGFEIDENAPSGDWIAYHDESWDQYLEVYNAKRLIKQFAYLGMYMD